MTNSRRTCVRLADQSASSNKRWTEEASRAAAGAGLVWQLSAAWCQQRTTLWYAEFTHQGTGQTRQMSLCSELFPTPAMRREEIVRHLRTSPR